jgi:oligopeptide transport system permease protein
LLLRFGNELWVVILAFTLTGWLGIAGLTRSQFYRYKNREYVLAARTLGAGDARIMARHIFPSAVGTIITSVVLYIPGVIFTESTFSFLGIINYADVISVGRLLSNGQNVMKQSFYQLLFPAIFISMLMLSFNLFGNGLRDAFNPSLRGVEE